MDRAGPSEAERFLELPLAEGEREKWLTLSAGGHRVAGETGAGPELPPFKGREPSRSQFPVC